MIINLHAGYYLLVYDWSTVLHAGYYLLVYDWSTVRLLPRTVAMLQDELARETKKRATSCGPAEVHRTRMATTAVHYCLGRTKKGN